ncbi:MAG: flippase activity-associated protein Agl23 [Pyrinomonadaceae bacterium]
MGTASTKSSRKTQTSAGPAKAKAAAAAPPETETEISKRTWLIASGSVLLIGALLRLYDLALVPLHHDEGVNGNFLVTLVRNHSYEYNPSNYHGPSLYYFSAIIPWLFRLIGGPNFGDKYGLTTFNIRFVTAAFGIGTIALVLLLRKRLGSIGALSAAALIAISPGAVDLSRYFIHETLFVFFALGIVVAGLKYYDTGRWVYLMLAGISAALMTATKETWIMGGPVLLIALITTQFYFWLRGKLAGRAKRKSAPSRLTLGERLQQKLEFYGGPASVAVAVLITLVLFLIVNVLFYSSFFTNYPKGVDDALLTLSLWSQRTKEHAHEWWQYIEWLRQEESPVLLLGLVGAVLAVWRADNRFALFAAQWAFGTLAAYSLVEYKTPWIALNFIVPLAITSGYTLNALARKSEEPLIPLALAVGAITLLGHQAQATDNWYLVIPIVPALGYLGYVFYAWTSQTRAQALRHFYLTAGVVLLVSGYQTVSLNFFHYDDDHYAYVYAHTRRELLSLVEEVDRVATRGGTGSSTGVTVVSPDYWPLPWYFRDYKRVGYYSRMAPSTEPVIIGSIAQEEEMRTNFGDRYQQVRSGAEDGSFALRPGVGLVLYVRKDLAR